MNAQQKIQKILSTVFENVEVSTKVADRKTVLGTVKGGYAVTTTSAKAKKFTVKSVKHAQEIVAEEIDMQADNRWHAYIMSDEYIQDFNSGTVKPRSSFYKATA